MNILDENIPVSQREALRERRVAIRQIGFDAGRSGLSDEDIVPYLRSLRSPTFFTRDVDYYRRDGCDRRYCLVWLDVSATRVAEFVRRVLRHPELRTKAARMGLVIKASPTGLLIWSLGVEGPGFLSWPRKRRK